VVRRLVVAVVCALALAAQAEAAPLLGVYGDAARFRSLTGQRSATRLVFLGWNQGYLWGTRFERLLPLLGDVPLVALKTGSGSRDEVITPREIAQGRGDPYLVALNHAIAAFGRQIYIRPFPEMNGHWSSYSAYEESGRSRGATHSTAAFRRAFARVFLILHGGPGVDEKLARFGLPPVAGRLEANPAPRLRVMWSPQSYGSPDVPGNSAHAYYPGAAYVDVVGNSIYHIGGKAEWAGVEALYRAYPGKPYAIAEWGLWGIDDPAFVRRMATFVRTHPRVRLVVYHQGKAGSPFDLASKPRSRAAYRQAITPLAAGGRPG
jgi:hypothetical protein